MSRRVTVLTPENVEVVYDLAGLGSRFLAALIDYFLIGCILTTLVLGAVALQVTMHVFSLRGTWAIALAVFAVFAVEWLYFIISETVGAGQTIGKRALGLRVMREGGFPVDFRGVLVRNIMRTMDFLPAGYAAGMVAVLVSRSNQRLGDMAAGTMVVRERGEAVRPLAVAAFPYPMDVLDLSLLSPAEIAVARRLLERAGELEAGTRQQLAGQVAKPLLVRLGRGENDAGGQPMEFLHSLVEAWDKIRV